MIDEDDNWDDDEDDKKEDNETITEEELRDLFDQCSVSSKGTGDRADVTYVHIYFRYTSYFIFSIIPGIFIYLLSHTYHVSTASCYLIILFYSFGFNKK